MGLGPLDMPRGFYATPRFPHFCQRATDADPVSILGQKGSVEHEDCRLPAFIPKWPSVELLELPAIFLSPYYTHIPPYPHPSAPLPRLLPTRERGEYMQHCNRPSSLSFHSVCTLQCSLYIHFQPLGL